MTVSEAFKNTLTSLNVSYTVDQLFNYASAEFDKIPVRERAETYQRLIHNGWRDGGIREVLKLELPLFDDLACDYSLDLLKQYATMHPLELKKNDIEVSFK